MAAVALLPALSLLAGAVVGLNVNLASWVSLCSLSLACAYALVCWWRRAPVAVLVALVLGFTTGGAALASDARAHALDSSIRRILNREFGGFLIDSVGPAGRHDPLPSRAVLVEDASRRDGFTSLRVEVVAIQLRGAWEPAEGGVAVSVNGVAADDRVSEWRAGRIIEAPITFRRPARYLNEGVPDFERDQALDGVTLLGPVKSGLLIDVVRNGGTRLRVVRRCSSAREARD